jgi:hypothetical protein
MILIDLDPILSFGKVYNTYLYYLNVGNTLTGIAEIGNRCRHLLLQQS